VGDHFLNVLGWRFGPTSFFMADVPPGIIDSGLRQINLSGRIAKGCNCTVKAIIKGKAKIVFVASDCPLNDYKTLITALCRKHNVKIHEGPTMVEMASAFGFVSLKADGSRRDHRSGPRKCSACALIKYGNVQNKAVEDFRLMLDPEARDGDKGSA
jgi:small subunit ribosomal protein S12e